MTKRVNMWSGPRSLSTAMMYSWRQRADTTVVDEPFYAYYLEHTGREHPGREQTLASQSTDAATVIRDVVMGSYDTPVVYHKQIAKHIVDLDLTFLSDPECVHLFLTREPRDLLTSWQVQLPNSTYEDTGFPEMLRILEMVLEAGQTPVVIETSRLLADPTRVLSAACEHVGLSFDEAMLSWPAGPKPEDGVWGEFWYDSVWTSTGWKPAKKKNVELLDSIADALEPSEAAYEQLLPYRI